MSFFDCLRVWVFCPTRSGITPDNAQLKNDRKTAHLLFPDDVLLIPDRDLRYENCATGARHRFVQKGIPEKLEIVLLDRDYQPRASLRYILTLDGVSREGVTDAGGRLEASPELRRHLDLVAGEFLAARDARDAAADDEQWKVNR